MMDDTEEDRTERAIGRGVQAQALMRNELLQEGFAKLEADYIQAWRTAPVRDMQMREKLFLAINVLVKVKDHLAKVLADGNVAQADLNMREKTRR